MYTEMPKHTTKRGNAKRSRSRRSNKKTRRNGRKMKGGILGIPTLGISKQRALTDDDFYTTFIARRIKFGFTVYTLYYEKLNQNMCFDFTTGFMNRVKYLANKQNVWEGIYKLLKVSGATVYMVDKKYDQTTNTYSYKSNYGNQNLAQVIIDACEKEYPSFKSSDMVATQPTDVRPDTHEKWISYKIATQLLIWLKDTSYEIKQYLLEKGKGIRGSVDKLFVIDHIADNGGNFQDPKAIAYKTRITNIITE